ncbi:MAG TPA: hypothetical protein VIV12_12405 [Streptosporangiaceae bacterium]
MAEAAGPAEVEWIAEPAIAGDEAAKRPEGFDPAQRYLLAAGVGVIVTWQRTVRRAV